MRRVIYLFIISWLLGASGYAQSSVHSNNIYKENKNTLHHLIRVSYDMAFPIGNTADLFDKTSFTGFTIDYQYLLSQNFAVGFALEYQKFQNKISSAEDIGSQPIEIYSKIKYQTIPLWLTAYYYPNGTTKKVSPYLGIRIGAQYNNFDIQSLLSFQYIKWQFALSPEIGISYHLGNHWNTGVALSFINSVSNPELLGLGYVKLKYGISYQF